MDNNEHLFHIFLVAKKEQLQFKMKKNVQRKTWRLLDVSNNNKRKYDENNGAHKIQQ